MTHRIALIHAIRVAIPPVEEAFARHWPTAPQLADCDAVMLAQFSTARAHAAVSAVLDCAVLTSPDSAVLCLRAAVNGETR